ncbi:hypothetical protein HUJ04_006041 [Dendroctonus ponderosae]|nr:hypothetical protein HUJ04_006041 [Dendroctonus ponderosae]
MALRWGIAFSGLIANDFVTALKGLPKEEHRAEKFAKTHNIPTFHEGYANLAKDPNVQVVYIGVLNPQHHEVAILMLENGKHVLCEKPFTLNEKLARQVIEVARRKKLFIMEAIWSRFFPSYQEARRLIKAGEIGDVKYASVAFGVKIDKVERVTNKDLCGSATLDIGVYILQFQQFVFQGLQPEKIAVAGHLDEHGVDDAVSAIFVYPDNKTAVVSCNTTVELPNKAVIVGSKGTIKLPTFWSPLTLTLNSKVKEFPLIPNEGKFNYYNSAGLAYQAIEVRKCILEGKLESDVVPHAETIQLAAWMDKLRHEVGMKLPPPFEDN